MLHIHNLPADITEEQVIALFGQYGTVVGFKFFEYENESFLFLFHSLIFFSEIIGKWHFFK